MATAFVATRLSLGVIAGNCGDIEMSMLTPDMLAAGKIRGYKRRNHGTDIWGFIRVFLGGALAYLAPYDFV